MSTRIKSDGKDLLESVTFLALALGETELIVQDGEDVVRFLLDFVSKKDEPQSIKWESVDGITLRISLVNFDNPLGTTIQEPAEIGIFKGRKLYVIFYIAKAGEKSELREVTFSTYLGAQVEVGDGKN